MTDQLLTLSKLEMRFRNPHNRKKVVHAVDGVDIAVGRGEIVGIVGESGSGKSTIGRCILGLERATSGSIVFDGVDLTKKGNYANRRNRAAKLQVVFQDPYSSLNPFRTIGQALTEPFVESNPRRAREAPAKAREVLAQVGLPAEAFDRYPNQFSGGQRQRVGIARALMLDPSLIICDEAVSALDLSTQAQVLNLLGDLAKERGISYLFIAHDLDVVQYLADRTVVLYRGRVMEQGPADAVHESPLHPYTRALVASAPVIDPEEQRERRAARAVAARPTIQVGPATGQLGCPFAARCPFAEDACRTSRPADTAVGVRTVACHLYDASSTHSAAGRGIPVVAVAS